MLPTATIKIDVYEEDEFKDGDDVLTVSKFFILALAPVKLANIKADMQMR